MAPNKDDNEETTYSANYIHIPSSHIRNVTSGFGETIFEQMKQNAAQIAQIDSTSGLNETYSSLLSRCKCTAQSMQAQGLIEDDVIALCSYNNMDYVVPLVAAWFTGVRMSPLDPAAPLSEILRCLTLTRPKLVFCDAESEQLIDSALQVLDLQCGIVTFGEMAKHTPFSDYLIAHSTEFKPLRPKHSKETACIMFSSGTTGLPKAVCVTQCSLLEVTRQMLVCNVVLTVTSPYWISNIAMVARTILTGKTRVICKTFDENTVVKVIQDYEVQFAVFTPTNCNRFIKNPTTCQYDTSKLQTLVVIGSNVTHYQLLEIIKLFPYTTVCNGYGLTEAGGVALLATAQTREDRLGRKQCSIGYPIPGFYYKVVNVETETALGPNETGELRIKTEAIMSGYYLQPELTRDVFDSESYLKTGDIVYYDETKLFYCVDRLKEIFKCNGIHISPTLIEGEILSHPDVTDCAVVGTPDELDGEIVTGVVVLREHSHVTANDIVTYVNDRVADRFKLRGGVVVVTTLPRTPAGKLRRKVVRDIAMKIMMNNT
ncbi:uncharacterized protein CBL_06880 [Carabus blaptoides fortunei]